MYNTKEARKKAVEAIRVIVNAARELSTAEQVLLKDNNSDTKKTAKEKPDVS